MKKAFFFLSFALIGILSFGQKLETGNLLGLHTFTPNLKQGVTMDEYVKFYKTNVVPAYEKAYPGTKMCIITSLRGADKGSMGVIFIFKNEADRNKYFSEDGTETEAGKAAGAKLSDIAKALEKYEMPSTAPDKYNDWLVK